MLLQTIVLSCLAALVSSQDLRCYECNPRSAGRCESLRNVAPIPCSEARQTTDVMMVTEEIIKMRDNTTEPFCFYLYFDAGFPEQSGYQRGCSTKTPNVKGFCAALEAAMEKRVAGGRMIGCKVCNVSGCNTGNFESASPTPPLRRPQILEEDAGSDGGTRIVLSGFGNFLVLCWFYFFKEIMF